MGVERTLTTVEAFDELIRRADRILELVAGEIIEVPSNPFVSAIAAKIIYFFLAYLSQNPSGRVTGEAGLYTIDEDRHAPDVAYISQVRQPELAVEVISDEANAQEQRELRLKISNCLAVGTTVWVVYPISQWVEVHRPGKPAQVPDARGTLDGDDVLPGFTLPVREFLLSRIISRMFRNYWELVITVCKVRMVKYVKSVTNNTGLQNS